MSGTSETEMPAPPVAARGTGKALVIAVAVVMLLVGLAGGFYLFKGTSSTPGASGGTVSGLPVPSTIPLVQGWYNNGSISYLDFGANTNSTAPILELTENGMPVAGQHNIIDVIPGGPGYSAFWRLYTVVVPAGYVADSVRSFQQVLDNHYTIAETTTVINCPVVNPGTTIQGQTGPLVQGWYRGQQVFYWGGETNSVAYGDVVGILPIYVLQFSNGTAVPNQRHIVGVTPGHSGYSDLWQVTTVTVGSSYVANTYESVQAVLAAQSQGKVTVSATTTLVNCPIVS